MSVNAGRFISLCPVVWYRLGHGWDDRLSHRLRLLGVGRGVFFRWIPGFTPEVFDHMQELFRLYDFWFVFLAGFTPIPYKIITIGAGVFHINFLIFVVASLISRGLRFTLIAAMIYRYGEPARLYIDQNFNRLTVVFSLLLIGGFIAIRYLF